VDLQQTLKYVKLSLKNTAKEKLFEILQMPKSTVGKNYAETGELKVKGKSPGRPRIVTQRSQRNLIKI
jgi:hypothetical protein